MALEFLHKEILLLGGERREIGRVGRAFDIERVGGIRRAGQRCRAAQDQDGTDMFHC